MEVYIKSLHALIIGHIYLSEVSHLVIDEVDTMLDRGFRNQVLDIMSRSQVRRKVHLLVFTLRFRDLKGLHKLFWLEPHFLLRLKVK